MEKMEKDLKNNIENFRRKMAQAGEEVVFHSFPTKILELTELIQTTTNPDSPFYISDARITDTTIFSPPPLSLVSTEPQAKKRKLENGTNPEIASQVSDITYTRGVSANKHMVEKVHSVIKKESEDLVAFTDQVRIWVALTQPKIEDGDNFGVGIQEEVLCELNRAQESAYNIRDTTRQDHIARAKICSKLIKYPNIDDYKLALIEHDDRQLYLARRHLYDLRNVYAVITDLIHKNISKIRVPKANNSVGLY